MRVLSLGGEWKIALPDCGVVWVWAEGDEAPDDYHYFGILVDTEGASAATVLITNRAPSDPNRVDISSPGCR